MLNKLLNWNQIIITQWTCTWQHKGRAHNCIYLCLDVNLHIQWRKITSIFQVQTRSYHKLCSKQLVMWRCSLSDLGWFPKGEDSVTAFEKKVKWINMLWYNLLLSMIYSCARSFWYAQIHLFVFFVQVKRRRRGKKFINVQVQHRRFDCVLFPDLSRQSFQCTIDRAIINSWDSYLVYMMRGSVNNR